MSDTGISSKLLKMKFMQKSATLIPTKINNDHKQPLSFFMSARDGDTSSESSDNEQELQV